MVVTSEDIKIAERIASGKRKVFSAHYGIFGDSNDAEAFMAAVGEEGLAFNVYGNKVQGQVEVHLEVESGALSKVRSLARKHGGKVISG